MKLTGRPSLFHFATAILLFSTVTLGLLTSRFVGEKESALEVTLSQSNMRLVAQTLERAEQSVLQTDKPLYDYLSLPDLPAVLEHMASAQSSLPPQVKHLYLLELDGSVLFPSEHADSISRFFRRKIFPQLQMDRITPLNVNHLHAAVDFRYSLYSLLKFQIPGEARTFLLVQEYDISDPDKLFMPIVQDLLKNYQICIRDYENNVVFGTPIPTPRKYFVEQRFPNTFYKWLFQLSPRNTFEIEQEEANRRLFNGALLAFNLVLILSAWLMVFVSRREEIRLTRQKEEFIRNVSHEMKTPLALIKMFSELLLMGRGKDESTRDEYLGIINAETERMTLLINNVLDFANLERGLQRVSLEELHLDEVVLKHLEAFDFRLKKENMSLTVSVEPGLPCIRGDRNALALVLLNLLDNAIKYAGEKNRRVDVRLYSEEKWVVLSVRDYGIGILPQELPRIFDKFFRSDNIAVRKVRGSGIGLSLVKYLVDAQKGDIRVESAPGEGSTFLVRFPRIDALPAS